MIRGALLLVFTIPACSSSVPAGPNPPRLWLAGINGSESNLQLVAAGPPSPF